MRENQPQASPTAESWIQDLSQRPFASQLRGSSRLASPQTYPSQITRVVSAGPSPATASSQPSAGPSWATASPQPTLGSLGRAKPRIDPCPQCTQSDPAAFPAFQAEGKGEDRLKVRHSPSSLPPKVPNRPGTSPRSPNVRLRSLRATRLGFGIQYPPRRGNPVYSLASRGR